MELLDVYKKYNHILSLSDLSVMYYLSKALTDKWVELDIESVCKDLNISQLVFCTQYRKRLMWIGYLDYQKGYGRKKAKYRLK